VVAVALKDFHDPPDKRAAFSSEPAGAGIVNQDGIPVGCDGVFSMLLVKL
jgi:hypothetical protein